MKGGREAEGGRGAQESRKYWQVVIRERKWRGQTQEGTRHKEQRLGPPKVCSLLEEILKKELLQEESRREREREET